MSKLITTAEAAKIAGCADSTLRYAISRGDLPAQKFGKTWVISEDDFNDWLNNPHLHKSGPKPRE